MHDILAADDTTQGGTLPPTGLGGSGRKNGMARRRSAVRIGVAGLGEREELAPGIFINTHYRGCTPGFIHTSEGIILVDAPLIPKQAIDWREQVETQYPNAPFLYMIN